MSVPERRASEASIARNVKRHVWRGTWTFRASCAPGLEELLGREVQRLPGIEDVHVASGAVRFVAPFDTLYVALLRLRTADTLRVRIGLGAAATFAMARDQLGRIPWAWWLPARSALEVRVRSERSRLRDAPGLERTLRQALQQHGIESDADVEGGPAFTVLLSLVQDQAEVWLDLAGDPLYRRGGDRWVAPTSLRETSAAAAALAADVMEADVVVDPFCGSATLLTEAGSILQDASVGMRRSFALEASPVWNAGRFRHAQRSVATPTSTLLPPLVGIDVETQALEAARHNLEVCGVARPVLLLADARTVAAQLAPITRTALRPALISNPPYGHRAAAVGAAPDALLREVVEVVTSTRRGVTWRLGLLYPRPEALQGVEGWHLERVERVRIRGFATALVRGTLTR